MAETNEQFLLAWEKAIQKLEPQLERSQKLRDNRDISDWAPKIKREIAKLRAAGLERPDLDDEIEEFIDRLERLL